MIVLRLSSDLTIVTLYMNRRLLICTDNILFWEDHGTIQNVVSTVQINRPCLGFFIVYRHLFSLSTNFMNKGLSKFLGQVFWFTGFED